MYRYLLIGFFATFTNITLAQSIGDLKIKKVTEIKYVRVNDIAIDNIGNKWFASEFGLSKLSDTTIIEYKRQNNLKITDNHISCIEMAGEVAIIGTYNSSILELQDNNLIYYDFSIIGSDTLGNYIVKKIVDRDNVLWALLLDKGILYYNKQNKKSIVYDFENAKDFDIDNNNIFWVGTEQGLLYGKDLAQPFSVEKKIKGEITKIEFINNKLIVANYHKTKSNIYISSNGYKWEKIINRRTSISNSRITDFAFDGYNNFWICGKNVSVYNNNNWQTIESSTFNPNLIHSIAIDKKNNIWVGTENMGAYLFSNEDALYISEIKSYYSKISDTIYSDINHKIDKNIKFQGNYLPINKSIEVNTIYFAPNKAILMENSKKTLDEIIDILNKTEYKIKIEGHTAKTQNAIFFYLRLSKRRAASVKEYLIKNGIESERIETKGYGTRKLKNGIPSYDPRNRRVEIMFIDE